MTQQVPSPPPDNEEYQGKKRSHKVMWTVFIVLGSCVLLSVFAAFIGSFDTEPDAVEEEIPEEVAEDVDEPVPDEVDEPTPDEEVDDETVSIDEPFELGHFGYQISEVFQTEEIGGQFTSESAGAGATFLIVSFAIVNLSDESRTIHSDHLEIHDAQGRTFSPSSAANSTLTMTYDQDLVLSQLQPEIPVNMLTAFEIPLDVLDEDFIINVPERGLLGTDAVEVRVSPDEVQTGFPPDDRT